MGNGPHLRVSSSSVKEWHDQSSFSNPSLAVSTSIHLEWTLDFGKQHISGSCKHSVTVVVSGTEDVDFDSSKLIIDSVTINNVTASYKVADADPQLGSKISVRIPEDLRAAGTSFDVLFSYRTGTDASAMQWLEPSATKGGKHPYVFTQSQAIHARSMLPCMDSPGVKATYTATVVAPEWCTVLMSALADDATGCAKGVFKWKQPVPTSAYLIALAAGNLESRDISNRVRIWSEPEVVDAAAFDFSETEDFLQAAEALTCPYAWTRYDVLCMPPSFPYGGMENPCLTFVTPTLLSGDKSLADVIAHEIAHSWTGNLITNSTWEHFWLNEGWTVWLERKIMASVRGAENSKLSAQIGWKHLKDDIGRMGADSGFTALVWPLGVEDPDDAFSSVPYEKGFNFLHYLEHLMGSESFGAFAKAYMLRFQFKCLTSGDFKDFFIEFYTSIWTPPTQSSSSSASSTTKEKSSKKGDKSAKLKEEAVNKLKTIKWDDYFNTKGMPADPVPGFDNVLANAAQDISKQWIKLEEETTSASASASASASGSAAPVSVSKQLAQSKKDVEGWSTQQVSLFLEYLLTYVEDVAPFSEQVLLSLNGVYGFTKSGNAEIRFRWQSLCLQSDVAWIVPDVIAFVTSQGRMKYVRPLYRALMQCKSGRDAAIVTFMKSKNMYHPIARKMVEADMKNYSSSEVSTVEAGNTVPTRPTPAEKSDKYALSAGLILLSIATIAGFVIFAKNRMK